MGNAKLNSWMQWILLIAVLASLGFSFVAFNQDDVVVNVPTAEEIAAAIVIPEVVPVELVEGELTDTSKVDEIYEKLFENDAWEDEAEETAFDELTERDNKDLFVGMTDLGILIDEKEDIESVVVKDVTFSGMDSDDKDATVTFELKVYYEDVDGNDLKEYVTVITEIEDGDIDNQDFELTI